MTALARLHDLDSRAWSAATWSAPLMTQLVLALIIATSWLLGKSFPGSGAVLFGVSAAAVFVLCAAVAVVLVRSPSSRVRGLALSTAGSYAVVLVGGAIYGFWILGW